MAILSLFKAQCFIRIFWVCEIIEQVFPNKPGQTVAIVADRL